MHYDYLNLSKTIDTSKISHMIGNAHTTWIRINWLSGARFVSDLNLLQYHCDTADNTVDELFAVGEFYSYDFI